jgi:endothelin-converting enzyme/putative endopeptidase
LQVLLGSKAPTRFDAPSKGALALHRVYIVNGSLKGSAMQTTSAGIALILLLVSSTSVDTQGVDAGIQPGDDFFAYANGDWLKKTDIPSGKSRWGARNEIDAKTQQQMTQLFADATSAPAGSYARKVADFRAAYANESAIDGHGLTPIVPLLKRIDAVQDKAGLARFLGSELSADVDPMNWGIYSSSNLFGLSVDHGIHGEPHRFAYLLQGGLALPDRDHYLNASTQMQALRTKYQAYIGRLLQLAGLDRASERAQAVIALETEIAKTHGTPEDSGDEKNADNVWSRADFSSKAPGMDWKVYFAAAGLSTQETIVAWQPGAIKGEAALVESQALEAWRDYLRFHVIDRYAEVLPRSIAETAFVFRSEVLGTQSASSREQRAIDATNTLLPELVGRMYVAKYFTAKDKARVQTIAANVIDAFSKRLAAVQWMTPPAKLEAMTKLKYLYFGVGYPESWTDDSRLIIKADDALGNLRRVSSWNYSNALAKLAQPTDTRQWSIPPQRVGAVLMFTQNAYNFSAALLQAPKYDASASDAANYGAIGAIIGHEVSHFVDTLGTDYDAKGALRRWWTSEDLAHYETVSDNLIRQFSGYRPLPDIEINGKLTLVENVADLGGLAAAFDAHRRALGSKANDKEFVRQQDREFFIGFARSWRSKSSESALRTQVANDAHAPDRYRIATVRNIDAWYEAFNVVPGQKFYLDPKDRVRIW